MAIPEIPPWLTRDYDPVGSFLKAFQIGSNISMEQARLREAQHRGELDAVLRREEMSNNLLKAQAALAVDSAYKQQQMDLAQAKMEQAKELAMLRAQSAAAALQARTDYYNQKLAIDAAKARLTAMGKKVYHVGNKLVELDAQGNQRVVFDGGPNRGGTITPAIAFGALKTPASALMLDFLMGEGTLDKVQTIANRGLDEAVGDQDPAGLFQ